MLQLCIVNTCIHVQQRAQCKIRVYIHVHASIYMYTYSTCKYACTYAGTFVYDPNQKSQASDCLC